MWTTLVPVSCPAASATASEWSTGIEHTVDRQGAGQRGPTQSHAGTLHRADGGQAYPQALAPTGVEASLDDQVARRSGFQAD